MRKTPAAQSISWGSLSDISHHLLEEAFQEMASKTGSDQSSSTPIETMSFEAALKELEDIVSRLEQGSVDLEDSIALYERGQALKTHCEGKLKAAEGRLEKIVQGPRGTVTSEPVDTG